MVRDELKFKNSQLADELRKLQKELTSMKPSRDFFALEALVASQEDQIKQYENRMKAYNEKVATILKLESEVSRLLKENLEFKTKSSPDIISLKAVIASQQDEIKNYEENVKAKELSISQLECEVGLQKKNFEMMSSKSSQDILSLKAVLASQKDEIKKYEEMIKLKNLSISQLEHEVRQGKENLEMKSVKSSRDILSLETLIANKEDEIKIHKAVLAKQEIQIVEYEDDVQTKEMTISQLECEVRQQKENFEIKSIKSSQDILSLEADVARKEDEIKKYEALVASQKDQIKKYDENMKAYNEQEFTISQLECEVSKLQKENSELKSMKSSRNKISQKAFIANYDDVSEQHEEKIKACDAIKKETVFQALDACKKEKETVFQDLDVPDALEEQRKNVKENKAMKRKKIRDKIPEPSKKENKTIQKDFSAIPEYSVEPNSSHKRVLRSRRQNVNYKC